MSEFDIITDDIKQFFMTYDGIHPELLDSQDPICLLHAVHQAARDELFVSAEEMNSAVEVAHHEASVEATVEARDDVENEYHDRVYEATKAAKKWAATQEHPDVALEAIKKFEENL